MTNKELQQHLAQFPDDMPVKLLPKSWTQSDKVIDLTDENILHTSETAHANPDAPEEEWDSEDGKIELGDGPQYLLFNPIIL